MQLLRNNGLILALLGAVAAAWLFPQLGASDGILHAGLLGKAGVMVIFLLQGLSLKTGELAAGLRQLRLHAFIQAWIFLLAPVVLCGVAWFCGLAGQPGLAPGFLYLALLPTTITSAIIFSGAGGGNVPAAIFNTTLSNVIGVFWVPAGCLLLFSASGTLPDGLVAPLLLKIARLILLPLLLGQLLRPLLHRRPAFGRVAPWFKHINQSIIVFIVYATFCDSFLADAWQGVGAATLALLLGVTAAALVLVHAGAWFSSRWITRHQADRVTALFCGSQKTLAAGVPMAAAIFAGNQALAQVNIGLLLLPLLCYHPLQLLLGALVLPKLKA